MSQQRYIWRSTRSRAARLALIFTLALVALGVVATFGVAAASTPAASTGSSVGPSAVASTALDLDEPPSDEDVVFVEIHDVDADGTVTITHRIFMRPDATEIDLTYAGGSRVGIESVGDVSGFDSADNESLEYAWQRSGADRSTTVLELELVVDQTTADAYRTREGQLLYGQLWYDGQVWGVGHTDVGYHSKLAPGAEGVVTDVYTYLGPADEHVEEVDGTSYRIVVPEGEADRLADSPAEVTAAIAEAATLFDPPALAGEPAHDLVVITPSADGPYNGRAHRGGDSLWVDSARPLASAGSTWLHEYVHTRQHFDVESDFQWFIEGSADYYTALLAVNLELATVDEALGELERGHAEGVLSDPDSWEGRLDYHEGARTAAAIDADVRNATDHERSLADVWGELHDHAGPIDHAAFREAIREVADEEAAARADAYVTDGERVSVPQNASLYTLPPAAEAPESWSAVGSAAESDASAAESDPSAAESATGTDPSAESAGTEVAPPTDAADEVQAAGFSGQELGFGVQIAVGLFAIGTVLGWVDVTRSARNGRSAHSPLLALLWINALLLVASTAAVAPVV